jgi:hypothetical protein
MVKPILIWLCDKRRGVQWWGVERVSSRFVSSVTVSFTVVGATAITLAAYSAYAMRPAPPPADLAIAAFSADPQVPNRAAKSGRLGLRLASADHVVAYTLAAAAPAAEPERVADPVIVATPAMAEPAPVAPSPAPSAKPAAAPKLAALTPAPLPQEKPKLLPPPPPAPQASNGVLDDAQIAGLRGRLRLTSDQAEYWPAVEAALRDVARTHLRPASSKISRSGRISIDISSPEVQKLIWAAMPLIARLREDQKTEVRKLARVIGLDQVASQI